jgi:hypothetical protein
MCLLAVFGYDEDIYNYVKEGETMKGPNGKPAVNGNNAKVSDSWYNFFDQQVDY